jgi:hypothetical protein
MHILIYAYHICYTPPCEAKKHPSAAQKLFHDQLLALWPAIKGSLAEVRKPCIRPHCPLCARGDKHPNYLLAYTNQGRRRCLYVPKAMVPVLERALENGRQIEQLLYRMGPALLKEFRAQYPPKTGPTVRTSRPKPRPKS